MFALLSLRETGRKRQPGPRPPSAGGPLNLACGSSDQGGRLVASELFSRLSNLPAHGGFLSCATLIDVIFCLAIASILLQGTGAKKVDFESQEGKPCICNSTFYKSCPPSSECLENVIADQTTVAPYKPFVNEEPFHDDYDPDHVPFDSQDIYDSPPVLRSPYPPARPNFGGKPSFENRPPLFIQPNMVERHRKIYVSPRKTQGDPIIHPMRIRIPVNVPEIKEPQIPNPKPLFKLKKYITYESKPEIQMVPVTKTIIKPLGLTSDQIIDETGQNKKLII